MTHTAVYGVLVVLVYVLVCYWDYCVCLKHARRESLIAYDAWCRKYQRLVAEGNLTAKHLREYDAEARRWAKEHHTLFGTPL